MFYEDSNNCTCHQPHCHKVETEVDYRTNFGDDLVVCGKVSNRRNGQSSVFRKRMEWRPGHKWGCTFDVPHIQHQEDNDDLDVEYNFLVWNNERNIMISQEDNCCKHSIALSGNAPNLVKCVDQWNENSSKSL